MNIHYLYRPILKYFRTKRMRQFYSGFNPGITTSILDIGGDPFNWKLLPDYLMPSIAFVNIYPIKGQRNWVIADGCALPFKDNSFDIAYSNSVIEHLAYISHLFEILSSIPQTVYCNYMQYPDKS